MLRDFDRMSVLKKFKSTYSKSFDYDEYFSSMDVSDEKKEEIRSLSKKLEIIFLIMFALYATNEEDDEVFLVAYQAYMEKMREFLDFKNGNSYIEEQAREVILEIIETTDRNVEDDDVSESEDGFESDSYYLSSSRAMLIAANEATMAMNYRDYVKAIKDGMNKKTWVTEKDNRVRKTHAAIDEDTIGIFELFQVGDSTMMFPKDSSLGADANEIVNCRCVARYSK